MNSLNEIFKDPNQKINLYLIIFLFFFSKFLFFFSCYILEYSFIVFRSTFNYVDFGVYSFNITDQNYTGVTSKLFGLICSLFRLIFNKFAIYAIVFFNIFLSIITSINFYLVLKTFIHKQNQAIDKSIFLFLLIFFNPSIFIVGVTGLEFSLALFFMSYLFLYINSKNKNWHVLLLCALLPATRFELIAVNLIFVFVFFIFNEKKYIYLLLFSILGILINFSLNLYFDHSIFPSSAISKWMTLSKTNHYDIENFLNYFFLWFFQSKSFFLGVTSKFIPQIIYVAISASCVTLCLYHFKYLNIFSFKNIDKKYKILILVLSLNIIFVPLSYVVAGHSFVWYFFPFSFLNFLFVGLLFVNSKFFKRFFFNIFISTILFLSLFQFLVLKNIGFQENAYRSNVGQYIYDISEDRKNDTLFLEPAGYIPYYAKITTIDTVGLTSPLIRKYRKKDKIKNWWYNFVFNEKPTFIVERRNVSLKGNVRDGNYVLSQSELKWFNDNYKIVKKFIYKDFVKNYGGVFKEFYYLGSHSDYYLFKLIK